MSHATVTETTGDANPNDRLQPVDARLYAAPASSTVDRFDNHAASSRASESLRFPGYEAKSLLSEFDDYVAGGGASRSVGHGFEVGDMVWGKVKSHPWWPGHVYNEAFASAAVRRTKREGHVLVAFFGDSSYGWFEPSELIPFDANFTEKSRQISSRNFLKAVEEAVDEASRRCGLGLVCRCRNPGNFCATNVEGYFSVQVPDYEPGVYSEAQIRRARSEFGAADMLSFVRQLALNPHAADRTSVAFTKNRATAFAFRRAVFEQYDETYAQAFGVQPRRPSDSPANLPVRHLPKAPLSGPMVIAETLGSEKIATKSVKVKDNFKKDKYLLMQRDEPSNTYQLSSRETPDAAGSYVHQKRPLAELAAPQALEKHEDTGFLSQYIAASGVKAEIAVVDQVQSDGSGLASQEIMLNYKDSSEEMTRSIEPVDVASKNMGRPDFSGEMALPFIVNEASQSTNLESKTSIDVKNDGNVIPSGPHEDFQQTEQGLLAISDEVKHHKLNADGVFKKIKVHKRPANDLKSDTSAIEGKKTKKMKKGLNLQPTSGHLEKTSTSEKSVQLSGKSEKSVTIGLAPREDLLSEPAQVDVSTSNLTPMDSIAEVNIELPQLLGDLQALALDPFHGVKRGIPAVTRQFFLRFRSLVYQKSLPVSPPTVTENEAAEVCVTKPSSGVGASDGPDDHARASPLTKPVKHIVRPDDPTKAGRKRALSDRQEENTAKRLKKIKDIKALAAEKKATSQKTSEARQGEGKESMAQVPPKVVKPELTRKVVRPAKAVEPTILVMKFPPKTSLPSVAELKARFARFGPMDQSGLRVFWKTSTCRVVFLHKVDAQSAYKYAEANQSLFGNVGVKCFLRELGDSSSEVSEGAKARGDNGANETPRMKDPAVVQRQTSVSAQQPPQLKSILKKSTGDELGQGTANGGSSKGTPRVKFMLGGEESSKGEQLMVGNRNNFNSASFADGGAPSVAMDFNSKNVHKAISQPSLPNIPPPQFTKIPQHNLHNSEMALRNTPNFINATASATATTVDISQQMIGLLTRCNDIVTNLTSLLGYVPYHPL
ncbi:DNA mismatch repair protein Msh6, partial [Mucuna pruriens]